MNSYALDDDGTLTICTPAADKAPFIWFWPVRLDSIPGYKPLIGRQSPTNCHAAQ